MCSDELEHRRRVEDRKHGPIWASIVTREYLPWDREHLVIDTAGRTLDQSILELRVALLDRTPEHP